jgi:hypothetical protein
MDFKALISKLDSMDAPQKTPAAPQLPKAVQLNEDAQLRVLSGRTTYVAEAKKKKEEDLKKKEKVDEEKSSTGGTIDRSTKGVTKHKENPDRYSDEPHAEPKSGAKSKSAAEKKDAPEQKKSKSGTWGMEGGKKFDNTKKESVEPEFKSKFMKMVEAKKDEAAKKKADAKKKKMDEAAKPDFLDVAKDGDKKEPMKKAAGDKGGDKKDSGKKGMSAAQEKYFGKKKTVKESVETKLSFKQMVQLVQESGGQQQIDAVDTELFAWANRVAKNKLGEGTKAELYAGLIYERNGGSFEMYDVLSESKKKIVESRSRLDEGMMDKVKSLLMSKLAPKLSDQEKDKMADVAKQVLGKDRADKSDFTLANIKAISKALGVKPEAASESIEEGPIDDFFGQKKVDPKSGMGTIGGIDAYHPDATLGEKLGSLTGILGGAAATIAGLFGGPAWLIIPGILSIMILSQLGMSKDGSS